MKKQLAIGIVTALFLIGCSDKNMESPVTSVAQMMKNTEVAGWTDYKQDTDKDKVPDYKDKCPNTPFGVVVNSQGCPLDSDNDGVANYLDKCPNTPFGIAVNNQGCPIDSDKDGVPDYMDKCPSTPLGIEVDDKGCALDRDEDGVADYMDKCLNTPKGAIVDTNGCSIDSDRDGVPDGLDKCPDTPQGAKVDKNGCAIDSDKDGVIDLFDKCLNTPKGVVVGVDGCAIDSDKDGVPDFKDKCPNTPQDVKVNFQGCPVIAEYRFNFEVGSYKIDKKYYPEIEKLAKILKANPQIKIQIQGYTDNKGDYFYNKELSLKRANALREILIKKYKIDSKRIDIIGYGSDHPIASNDTPEGRALNRRIEVIDETNSGITLNDYTPNKEEVSVETEKSENFIPKKIDK
jgi:outer membrane protein OmpA-like peptidoglycan-associated protein